MNENIFYYNEKRSIEAYLYLSTVSRYLNKKESNGNSVKRQLFIYFCRFSILLLIMIVYWHPVLKAQTNIGSFRFLSDTSVSSIVSSQSKADAPPAQSIISRTGFLFSSPVKSTSKNNFLFDRSFKGIKITNNNTSPDNISGRTFLFANLQQQCNRLLNMSLIPDVIFKKNSKSNKNTDKDKSFFRSNLFYFVGAAVLAVTVYLLWPKKESPANSNITFGVPPLPH